MCAPAGDFASGFSGSRVVFIASAAPLCTTIARWCDSVLPDGLELSRSAAQANHNSRADHGAGKAPQPFRPPAGSASASCWAELGVRWSLAETCAAL